MSGTKNLIMGLWMRHAFWPIGRFVASLHRTEFNGDVCIFVDDVTTETVKALQKHGVIVERVGPSAQANMPLLSGRFFNYLDFLARHHDDYAHVMLADARNVVFQSDPFATPLPADIVYAQQRRRLGDASDARAYMVKAYGESVAHNLRDCPISCPGTTIGSASGILRYLVAMTHELGGRTQPITGRIDHAVHNYVARMHPLRDAWVDPTDSIIATMQSMPDTAIRVSEQGVLIDGKLVPVLNQWHGNEATAEYVRSAPRFRLDELAPPRPADRPAVSPEPARTQETAATGNAVVAFYHRQRDAGRMFYFLESLRGVGYVGSVHCVGAFNSSEQELLSQHDCTVYSVAATDPGVAENIAHFYLSQIIDRLAVESTSPPDQVLVFDSMRAVFLRDPFISKTIGLSVFSEGPTRIGESDYNRYRLGLFTSSDARLLQRPIISSALLRGPLPIVREFYRRLLLEFVGRQDLLGTQKVIQGAINKLCYAGFDSPVIVHPNGAEVYFDSPPSELSVDLRQVTRFGGAAPAIVLSVTHDNDLTRKLAIYLGLR